jgi:hypothetical protein
MLLNVLWQISRSLGTEYSTISYGNENFSNLSMSFTPNILVLGKEVNTPGHLPNAKAKAPKRVW